ncbi:MAG: bifunctional demethylmenaquinone methyltransferase/2-methoxy-6-polyprenyl-1,4-benzoquinol methylase UbiE [Peptococcaceae bacterium]|mgnify:CR=1 FL=1|jgi:demethylmenaquinone methyltransferase/2-methoxy-6-polyprenyl-1,4-benzoquinol methylase|nr:bifunctional demethylmenaquinone methyltransferase/2-methoxy-6-polyprenyl-1,4-benzoquinol methylase UbiE [Peptococcaceae bacterium]
MNYSGKRKSQYVKDTFNSIAGKYDFMNSIMSLGLDKRWRKKVVEVCQVRPGMSVVDICCGTGMLTRELAEAVVPSGGVIGIDFSERMLTQAAKNLEGYAHKDRVTFLQGDALDLPFADNSFDGATIGWGLRNLPDASKGVLEMYRVVKPGAMVVSIDMGKTTLPIFKQLYGLYFEKLIPLMGGIWASGRDQYRYLYESASEFYSQKELVQIFQTCGLENCNYLNLALGAVAIVYGQKPKK